MAANQQIQFFGIRHHGPGSARSLLRALEAMRPDCILVEGPPDADTLIPLAAEEGMEPPVALLVYAAEQPQRAVFYPFAEFSPEWQSIRHALSNSIPVRFMDLPQAFQLEIKTEAAANAEAVEEKCDPAAAETPQSDECLEAQARLDPISLLAGYAGYSDGERWWEHIVEHRLADANIFAAIADAMHTLRETVDQVDHRTSAAALREARREAYMRKTIREARKEGHERIAVVCGAWHVPALKTEMSAKVDAELLKGLPKIRTEAAWTPWTYGRLTQASGYGAGVQSPGWYEHLWRCADQRLTDQAATIAWLARVARMFREEDLDVSSAHLIEATRLAETMAQLGGQTRPGLAELNEAVRAVICMGEEAPLALLHRRLVVSEKIGRVAEKAPVLPLVADLDRQQRRLRIKPEALERVLDLDLRKEGDLGRSHLLHRLNLLNVPWGKLRGINDRAKGTFHEIWQIQWHPEFAVALIEASIWGNTVEAAAGGRAIDAAEKADQLSAIAAVIDRVLLAQLDPAIGPVLDRLEAACAVAADVTQMMQSLPQLANALRYGNVRQTNLDSIGHILRGLVARVCIGLPAACMNLDNEAARALLLCINDAHEALRRLNDDEQSAQWFGALESIGTQDGLPPLLVGRACRLLLDEGRVGQEEIENRMARALSAGNAPAAAAMWLEGFLWGSGAILIHDQRLWSMIDEWVCGVPAERFIDSLPVLRRAFAEFTAHERRQLGERTATGASRPKAARGEAREGFDPVRAERILPALARVLGLEGNGR